MAKRRSSQGRSAHPRSTKRPSTWGSVEIKKDPGHTPLIPFNSSEKGAATTVYIWSPSRTLQRGGHVSSEFSIGLLCETATNGERRLSPIGQGDRSLDPFMLFYTRAFASGHAITGLCISYSSVPRRCASILDGLSPVERTWSSPYQAAIVGTPARVVFCPGDSIQKPGWQGIRNP